MTLREKEEARILERRGRANEPIEFMPAGWDGHRSVRIIAATKTIGLATTAYSYALTDAEKEDVARRLSALWNLAAERAWTTDEIIRRTNERDVEIARSRLISQMTAWIAAEAEARGDADAEYPVERQCRYIISRATEIMKGYDT